MAKDTGRRVIRVLEHIRANPAGDLSPDALSELAAMSRFHWHRQFLSCLPRSLPHAARKLSQSG